MLCPKCYGKLSKDKSQCLYCGFEMKELEDASNKQAKQAKKTIYRDDVLYTAKLPYDVSKKRLLLFSIFLGLFGVHDFYVGKFWQGLYKAVTISITLILATILIIMNTITNNIVKTIFDFVSVFQGLAIIFWIWDIFSIAFERYKVPVYKDEFSKQKQLYKK